MAVICGGKKPGTWSERVAQAQISFQPGGEQVEAHAQGGVAAVRSGNQGFLERAGLVEADSIKSRKSRARSARRIGSVKRKWTRTMRPPPTATKCRSNHGRREPQQNVGISIHGCKSFRHVTHYWFPPMEFMNETKHGNHRLNLSQDQHAQRQHRAWQGRIEQQFGCGSRRGTDKFRRRAENRRQILVRLRNRPDKKRREEAPVRRHRGKLALAGGEPLPPEGEFRFRRACRVPVVPSDQRVVQRHAALEHQRQGGGDLGQAGFLEGRNPPAQGAPHVWDGHGNTNQCRHRRSKKHGANQKMAAIG